MDTKINEFFGLFLQYVILFKFVIDYFWNIDLIGVPLTHIYSGFVFIVLLFYFLFSFNAISKSNSRHYKWVFVLLSLMILQFVFSLFVVSNKLLSINYFIKLISPLLIFFVFQVYSDNKIIKRISFFLILLFAINFVHSIINLQQYNNVNYGGLYYFKLDLARYCLLLFIFALIYFKDIRYKLAFTILPFLLILITNSRISILSAFFVFLIYVLFRHGKVSSKSILFVVLIIVLSFIFVNIYNEVMLTYFDSKVDIGYSVDEHNFQGRINIYAKSYERLQDFSFMEYLFGRGFASTDVYLLNLIDNDSHNGYLSVLGDNGFVGLILISGFFLIPLFNLRYLKYPKTRNHLLVLLSLSACIFINNISDPGYYTIQITWIYALILVLFVKEKKYLKVYE
jgi:O-antigen ligase